MGPIWEETKPFAGVVPGLVFRSLPLGRFMSPEDTSNTRYAVDLDVEFCP